ncbi:threonylcarbamoyl-AMP synthase [bacterium]|nr:threonylcarbamoyl-AMP synthase [bacterium]
MNRIDLQQVKTAAEILRNGGIVIYPTETVYGIGCDPLNGTACARVQSMKKRDRSKPFILIADTLGTVESWAGKLDDIARRCADAFWPGPLTLVIRPGKKLPAHLRGPSGGIAFRVTPHPVAAALSREFGSPVVSTSANMTGDMPVTTYEQAAKLFSGHAGMILETPAELDGEPSTVIDLTGDSPQFLRIGAIGRERILEVL